MEKISNKRKKILFVAMSNSIHTARWINMLKDEDWDIYLVGSKDHILHDELCWVNHLVPKVGSVLVKARSLLKRILLKAVGFLPPAFNSALVKVRSLFIKSLIKTKKGLESSFFYFNSQHLVREINIIQPDLIHSLEFQSAGYMVLSVKLNSFLGKKFPKWLATNWGSDIFYFQKFPQDLIKIKRLLENIDYYSCETERDLKLAKIYGLKVPNFPIVPNAGGFKLEMYKTLRDKILTSKRKYIMVKGYQNMFGESLRALCALEMVKDLLKGYSILVYLGENSLVYEKVSAMQQDNIDIRVVPHRTHEEMMELHSKSRIHLAISNSDGLSTSMLEAMVMGSFPIQTDTSGAPEWLDNGHTGFVVPCDNINYVSACLRKALTDDELVDNAAVLNWKVAEEKLDYNKIREKVLNEYNNILE